MTAYIQECDGELRDVITNAIIFEAADVVPGVPLKNRFFTANAAWDTGAEVTVISSHVIKALGLKPFDHSTIVGIGGDEEVDIYKVHLGLPNGYLYKNRYVYCSEMADYDILIGMDIIAKSDFFLTNIDGKSRFLFRLPAQGKAE